MELNILLIFTTVCFYVDGITATSTVGTTEQPDPCDFYKPMPSAANRSVSNKCCYKLNNRFIIEDWYGLRDLIIPTDPPNIGHCATAYPIYLQDGPIMSEPNIQVVTACIRGLTNLCEVDMTIQSKVCSSHLVIYYLKRSPVSQSAYCLGSPTGDAIPTLTTTPSVIVTTEQDVASSPVQFRFFCRFTSSVNNLYYRADWYINNQLIYTSPLSTFNQDEERSLTEKKLREKGVTSVRFNIKCEISTRFHTDTSVGLPSTSQPVYVANNTKMIESKCYLPSTYFVTFDDLNKYLQLEGTFTIYAIPGYNIEVQVQTSPCALGISGNGYCNCGMVVRVGRTVFMINHCSLSYWFVDYILCDDDGDIMDIKKHGSDYKIELPTGTGVVARVITVKGTAFLQVYIFPSVIDIGVTEGLCGNNNGIKSDDLQLRDGNITTDLNIFCRDWRVSIEGNLFDQANLDSLESWSREYITCKCHHDGDITNEIDCSPTNSSQTCSQDEHYQNVHQKRCIKHPKKRSSARPKGIKRIDYCIVSQCKNNEEVYSSNPDGKPLESTIEVEATAITLNKNRGYSLHATISNMIIMMFIFIKINL